MARGAEGAVSGGGGGGVRQEVCGNHKEQSLTKQHHSAPKKSTHFITKIRDNEESIVLSAIYFALRKTTYQRLLSKIQDTYVDSSVQSIGGNLCSTCYLRCQRGYDNLFVSHKLRAHGNKPNGIAGAV
jgi:hypothetical protein